ASNGRDVVNAFALAATALGLRLIGFTGPILLQISATLVLLTSAFQGSIGQQRLSTLWSVLVALVLGSPIVVVPEQVYLFFRTALRVLFLRGRLSEHRVQLAFAVQPSQVRVAANGRAADEDLGHGVPSQGHFHQALAHLLILGDVDFFKYQALASQKLLGARAIPAVVRGVNLDLLHGPSFSECLAVLRPLRRFSVAGRKKRRPGELPTGRLFAMR